MAAAFKFGGEVLVHDGTGGFFGNEATWHHQHIGVVVLTDQMGNLRYPAETGTDALVFVERHVDTLTGTADSDTREHLALLDALSQRMAEVRVVAGVLGIGTVVLIGVALLVEVFLDELL
uniref:Uncharacterized protein n=1 Tax=uncultured bacterium r_02 TaxID=1132277 RepID=I6YTC8_9BACT|nr:hypothetical protein [uncultured bacterium r_02]